MIKVDSISIGNHFGFKGVIVWEVWIIPYHRLGNKIIIYTGGKINA